MGMRSQNVLVQKCINQEEQILFIMLMKQKPTQYIQILSILLHVSLSQEKERKIIVHNEISLF